MNNQPQPMSNPNLSNPIRRAMASKVNVIEDSTVELFIVDTPQKKYTFTSLEDAHRFANQLAYHKMKTNPITTNADRYLAG
ncbi:MAG: hypothetical protein KTR14_02820 [Vampirovibrio sp.]|nr:hypothetical protein [Vampirovibrio sp.]